MLYILGGAPRGGKSIIARKLLEEQKIPYFCTDFLISVLDNGTPELEINHSQPFILKAEKLWPLIKHLLYHLVMEEEKYLIEGDCLLPKHFTELRAKFPNEIKICFTGYTELTPEKKLKEVRTFNTQKDDWTTRRTDEELLPSLERMVEFSKHLQEECSEYNVPYFDSSKDFKENVDKIVSYFISK